MKKIMIASGLLALMAAATSCDKYDIYPEQYGDVLMIKDAGEKEVTIYATDDAAEYYVSVMKGGHTPGEVGHAELRVMTEEDFKAYKDLMYGDPEFPGLDYLDPEFYSLADAQGNPIEGTVVKHDFNGENERFFGVNVLFNAQKISDWREQLEATEEGKDLLGKKNFVVPIGLYSSTDSVNADGQALMIQPVVTDPVMSINVEPNTAHITEISRGRLIGDPEYVKTPIKSDITLSIPCKNPYGFRVKFDNPANGLISEFNSMQSMISLTQLKNNLKQNKIYFNIGVPSASDPTKREKFIDFPAGVTEVTFPLEYVTSMVDPNELTKTYGFGIKLLPAYIKGKTRYDMEWAADVPEKVKKSLKLPVVPGDVDSDYTFWVGYKVVETPLELDDSFVTTNDPEPKEGSIAALFDNDLSTFFHSGWTVENERSAPFGSYLEITIPPTGEEYNACYFQFTSRNNNAPASPKEVHIYYTNEDDPELRQNTNAWKFMGKVELKKALGTSEVGEIGTLAKPIVTEDYSTYKYLRFCVIKSQQGNKEMSLLSPSTSQFWNLAELRMYAKKVTPEDLAE